jgi:hypothetical protein
VQQTISPAVVVVVLIVVVLVLIAAWHFIYGKQTAKQPIGPANLMPPEGAPGGPAATPPEAAPAANETEANAPTEESNAPEPEAVPENAPQPD